MTYKTNSEQLLRAQDAPSWERLLGATNSPIEQGFLFAFCDCAVAYGYGIARRPAHAFIIGVSPQCRIGPYFLDFGIHFRFFGSDLDLAIECDGHAFHRRTARQAGYEDRRQRTIAAHGYRVLRFTGSEINAGADRCALEALDHIMDFQTSALIKASGRAA